MFRLLQKEGLFPQVKEEAEHLKSVDPYTLRIKALDEKLEPYELGRALFHLGVRRGFKSNRKDGDGINAMLNYGYTVVRASVARAICAAGLLPSLGIFHDNKLNAFCLADDFMESFRPLADIVVYLLSNENKTELTPETKKYLTDVLFIKVKTTEGYSPLSQSMSTRQRKFAHR